MTEMTSDVWRASLFLVLGLLEMPQIRRHVYESADQGGQTSTEDVNIRIELVSDRIEDAQAIIF